MVSFYYVDERKEDGSPAGDYIDGDAHANHFAEFSKKPRTRTVAINFRER